MIKKKENIPLSALWIIDWREARKMWEDQLETDPGSDSGDGEKWGDLKDI